MNRAIAWFAENSVAANLLMVVILASGLITIGGIELEIFPEFSADVVSVSVVYRGAAPEEVEEGVCVRIEEAVQSIEGIKRIRSTASENRGSVNIELVPGTDARRVLEDVKSAVDAIDTFPDETEQPVIQEVVLRRQVINVAVSGDADETALKYLGEQVRDEITAIPGITQAELSGARPYEVSIEVSEAALRRFNLTFDEVVRAVRRSSLDLPGGAIKTQGGEILLRTKGQAYRGAAFENIVLRTRADGAALTVGDVATVVDGFADADISGRFDLEPGVMVQVFRVGEQDALDVSRKVKEYIGSAESRMPEGISLTVYSDFSRILEGRLNLMLKNGRGGFILVLVILALFLRLRLAFWIALGIPISFLGAIAMMPTIGASINLISLFAFIVVLGIVVDDAIVVGENIYRRFQQGERGLRGAIAGAQEVAVPVTFAILTSIAAFSPLLMVPGTSGKIMRLIPEIVILTLVFSLVESLLILPAHLAHAKLRGRKKTTSRIGGLLRRFRDGFSSRLEWIIHEFYRPFLEKCLAWRYLSASVGVAALTLTAGLILGGWIGFVFLPQVPADNVAAILTMPQGTPAEVTARVVRRLESSAIQLQRELESETNEKIFTHMLALVGDQPLRAAQRENRGTNASFSGAHLGEVNVELTPAEERSISSIEIARRWRELAGPIPDATELNFTSSLFSVGEPINIQLTGPDYAELRAAAEKLKARLAEYPGVLDIADSFRPGKKEVKLALTDEARLLGLTMSDLARQVRQAFYGEEAQRIQRGRDDVRVMVRYPESERRSMNNLETMRLRTPEGVEVPFSVAARTEPGRGYAAIRRTDRQRIVSVTADVDEGRANANEVLADVVANALPAIVSDHPRVRFSLEGEQREQQETMAGLSRSFGMALFVIFGLLAIPFRSYLQPLIIMAVIPFGFVGAVMGHIIMGLNLTILSIFGLVALSGVVINDSLVMVDFINRRRKEGKGLQEAIRESGMARFRPILLTSLTTFAGLTPLLFEKSLQAQLLIPMATSLGFGVIFGTAVILILVPVTYAILEDIRHGVAALFRRQPAERRDVAPETGDD
ncbi:MAG: efflux RND transporter permease subunit [Gemmatimonadota bacterium]|nr:efflux RND transporter permease subunit [Gemmatimonadota bacterium]